MREWVIITVQALLYFLVYFRWGHCYCSSVAILSGVCELWAIDTVQALLVIVTVQVLLYFLVYLSCWSLLPYKRFYTFSCMGGGSHC